MIRFGIIGMGIRGRIYADTIAQSPDAKLTAISDLHEETLAKNEAHYGVEGYKDAVDMIDRANLDAVIIATPDDLHTEPVIAAARKGLHMLIEKPFTNQLADAERMHAAIEQAGVHCMIAFENRWNTPFVAVKQAIEAGEIGNVITLNARLNDTIFVPTKMLRWSRSSSPGWFLFPHLLDLAMWIKGVQPTSVYAVGTKKKLVELGIDTYDSIQTIVSFSDQTHATFTTSWVLPDSMPMIYDLKYEIIGEDGALYVDLNNQMVQQANQKYQHLHSLGTPINGQLTAAPNYMLQAFIEDLRLDRMPSVTHHEGLVNTKVIDAIHQSVQSGTIIQI